MDVTGSNEVKHCRFV